MASRQGISAMAGPDPMSVLTFPGIRTSPTASATLSRSIRSIPLPRPGNGQRLAASSTRMRRLPLPPTDRWSSISATMNAESFCTSSSATGAMRKAAIIGICSKAASSMPPVSVTTGRGVWIELSPESTGMSSQAEISVHTRQAASAVNATTMDRPEWVAVNPASVEAYCCLTHNENRGRKPNAGGDPTPVGGPNPRAGNRYGQIVRWVPDHGDHASNGFSWDLFVTAGNPTVHDDANAGSPNINKDNMFNSPDGLAFDATGLSLDSNRRKLQQRKGICRPGQQSDAGG